MRAATDRFVYNLSPDTFTAENLRQNDPFGYLLAPNNATPQLTELAGQVRAHHLPLLADNGNFVHIGRVADELRPQAERLRAEIVSLEARLERSVHPGDLPVELTRAFFDFSVRVRERAQELAGNGEEALDSQLQLHPTHLIGVENITAACWLALDLERTYTGRPRRDWERMNSSTAARAARRQLDLPVGLRSAYYPVACAESYNTAFDAGIVFASHDLRRISMGFGAFMADANYTDHAVKGRRRIEFGSRLPNRYIRTVLVAKGFFDGYTVGGGEAPDGFHCLGLGAPIMLPLVALCTPPTTELTFDATSPIKDALRDGVLYVTSPAYMKIRMRASALWLATDVSRRWDCPCPFCGAFTADFPFNYEAGHAWSLAHPDQEPAASDLRPDGALYDAYPLFAEPPSGMRRDAVDHARVGHNHWVIEQILQSVRGAADEDDLESHVRGVVEAYAPRTSAPYANAVTEGLRLAVA